MHIGETPSGRGWTSLVSDAQRFRIARRLATARVQLRWSQKVLAEEGGWCGETTIRAMELGTRSIPMAFLVWVEKLAQFHKQNRPPRNGGRRSPAVRVSDRRAATAEAYGCD